MKKMLREKYELAITDLGKLIELDPANSDAYIARGEVRIELGQYSKAIADFNKVIKQNPENACAYNMQGKVYFKQRKYKKAIANFDKAILLEPEYPEAYGLRGCTHKALWQPKQAIADLEKALELNPELDWVERELDEARGKNRFLENIAASVAKEGGLVSERVHIIAAEKRMGFLSVLRWISMDIGDYYTNTTDRQPECCATV